VKAIKAFREFNTDELINQAKKATDSSFLRLIELANNALEHEQKAKQINGRLVRLPPSGRATIIGDLHGDLISLMHILKSGGFLTKAQKGDNDYLIFLGDYGDRGLASPEVYYIVLKLKELFPDKVILMRGNHEGPKDLLPYPHDLPAQLKQKYGEKAGARIYAELRRLFDHLYTAVVIEERAVLIHGGPPNKARSIRDLAYAHKRHPKETYLEEMLWSDPEEELEGTQPSLRGAGKLFGPDVTEKLLKLLRVKVLIRGHESCQEGFKINHNGKVLTLFSTNKPPYSNKHAAYLQLNLSKRIESAQQLEKSIKQFQ
jgi:protein phosphatase